MNVKDELAHIRFFLEQTKQREVELKGKEKRGTISRAEVHELSMCISDASRAQRRINILELHAHDAEPKLTEKNRGLYKKWEVTKLTNPTKKVDCIVLEFDDPIACKGIEAFARACQDAGYEALYRDLMMKLGKWSNL